MTRDIEKIRQEALREGEKIKETFRKWAKEHEKEKAKMTPEQRKMEEDRLNRKKKKEEEIKNLEAKLSPDELSLRDFVIRCMGQWGIIEWDFPKGYYGRDTKPVIEKTNKQMEEILEKAKKDLKKIEKVLLPEEWKEFKNRRYDRFKDKGHVLGLVVRLD